MPTEQENIENWRKIAIPFVQHLGIDIARMAEGRCELRLDVRPEHLNSFGVLHGGAIMTLLDVSLAGAARSVQPDMGVVTIEMKTTFMQPARGPVSGHGRLMHRTGRMAFVEGTLEDAEGRVCAHATGTFKYMPRAESTPTD
ncbi:PaaI family thioesterase [Xylophilus sp. GOD-11R]|uniref:PaaI family thioesterase n=1 Tax=Xylophilus sp. GOD-11R TaxID=3089814 RepID=UPI00298BCAE7|nr:PaaI family thioesterase [Xylophilus sp. GOD-11R]WPB59256.1 PaaI family thioesterase [Xylophilus sp. GOD-11R]